MYASAHPNATAAAKLRPKFPEMVSPRTTGARKIPENVLTDVGIAGSLRLCRVENFPEIAPPVFDDARNSLRMCKRSGF
jgi:hypothetical protein